MMGASCHLGQLVPNWHGTRSKSTERTIKTLLSKKTEMVGLAWELLAKLILQSPGKCVIRNTNIAGIYPCLSSRHTPIVYVM